MNIRQKLPAILLVFVLASCAPSASETLPANNEPQQQYTQTPSGAAAENPLSPIATPDFSGMTPPPAETNPYVLLAEQDLVKRLGVGLDQVHFLKSSEIDWPDITQACTTPPGQTSTKGRVSGYRIWLEANGTSYLYHIGLDQQVVACTQSP